jgi:hypothetical protein
VHPSFRHATDDREQASLALLAPLRHAVARPEWQFIQGRPGSNLPAVRNDAIAPNAKGRHLRYVVAIATGDLGELLRLSVPFSEIVVFNTMVAAV